jgi:hypothetical protein
VEARDVRLVVELLRLDCEELGEIWIYAVDGRKGVGGGGARGRKLEAHRAQ